MPCQSYESNSDYVYEQERKARALRDKLARIACNAMTMLEKNGLYLDNKEAQSWFKQHKIDDAREERRKAELKAEELHKKKLREGALKKLTPAERNELGIK